MNVFDFDNTLYHGESAVDFAVFMIRSNPKIILWMPKIFWNLLKYKLCLVNKDNMEAQIDRFMQSCLQDQEALFPFKQGNAARRMPVFSALSDSETARHIASDLF